MSRRVRVDWNAQADKMSEMEIMLSKNHMYLGETLVTYPDRFYPTYRNGIWCMECHFCGDVWHDCECEVGWP